MNNRWMQLTAGIIAMVAIANLQYGWTLFVGPLDSKFGWGRPAIQVAFTLFVLAETWLVPIEGYLVDRFGPRPLVSIGGVLVGLAWLIDSFAASLAGIYAGAIIGGVGAGIVYGSSVGNSLKWFPDRRGLAAGLTAAAFGAGSAVTIVPISHVIATEGYAAAFLWFGLGQSGVLLVCALVMRAPPVGDAPAAGPRVVEALPRDFAWMEIIQAPLFWLMYLMFTMVSMGGLMAGAQLAPMAQDFGVAETPVRLLGVSATALSFALSLDRVLNGLSRPFFGWVSDHLGRENTMAVAFGMEGLAILLLINLAHIPVMFVVLTGLTFFAWGEVYSLFPALCGDLFGRKFATTNYGLLYTAKGTASLLVPLGSLLQQATGSWEPIFLVAIAFDWTTALLALTLLKPLCRRWQAERVTCTSSGSASR